MVVIGMDAKIETLLAVVEKNNFTRVAESLHLTQPAVSHHIRSLEQEFGVRIFVRSKGNLKLTPEGETVVQYAKRIKALYGKVKQELSDKKKHMERITIGITHTSESSIVAETLAKYGRDTPGIMITILTSTINNLYAMMENYNIDLAIVEGRVNNPEMNSILLDTDYLVCVVSANSPLAKKSMVTLNDIKKENMILRLPNSGTRNLFISHLESIPMSIDELKVILEVDNIATIKDLIRKDIGISILARSACLDELNAGRLVALPIENLSMIREVNVLYRKDFTHTDVLQGITKIYREMAKLYSTS